MSRAARYSVAAIAAAAVAAYILLYTVVRPSEVPIRSDGYSYYVYLPSWFLYHDPSLTALANEWYGGPYPEFTAIVRWPSTGRWLDPHPIGPALLMIPFFWAAHLLSYWSNLPPDGFSFYYQHAAGLAGLFYFVTGLAILRRLLEPHFTSGVVLATIVSITFGTNLFHYGTFDATFSHAFSFFLICAFLLAVERWWAAPRPIRSIMAGAIAGLIVLTRHTNVIFLVLLPLYGVTSAAEMRSRLAVLWERRVALAVLAVTTLAVVAPQLILYRWITGAWLVSPYSRLDMGFAFRSPRIFGVLFSTEKGLFFWSPLLLLAVAGVFVASRWAKQLVLPATIVFLVDLYLIASWRDWQFGGSFGHRGFTDALGLAAPFLASAFAWSVGGSRVRRAVPVVAACAVLLSALQMAQFWMGVLPIANTTWTQYRELFLKFR